MTSEIKRNTWSRFCRKFNLTNQYRSATVQVRRKDDGEVEVDRNVPFMGIAIAKKGRLIDGVDLFTGQMDPGRLTRPVISVKQPVRIVLEKDTAGTDSRLSVESEDGTVANVVLSGEKNPQNYHASVEKVAYSMWEKRGYAPGSDVNDWHEAEKKIKEVELQLVP